MTATTTDVDLDVDLSKDVPCESRRHGGCERTATVRTVITHADDRSLCRCCNLCEEHAANHRAHREWIEATARTVVCRNHHVPSLATWRPL